MMLSPQQRQSLTGSIQNFPFEQNVKNDLVSAVEIEPTKEMADKVFTAMRSQIDLLNKVATLLDKEDQMAFDTIEAELDVIEDEIESLS